MKRRCKKLRQPLWFGGFAEEPTQPPANEVIPFDFESHAVRVVMRDGNPWWVAADVCRALGIGNPSITIRGQERRRKDGTRYWSGGLDADEWGIHSVNTPSDDQQMLTVNEPGLYMLMSKSRRPEAKRFMRWIAHEVIPTIRRTGSYSLGTSGRVLSMQKELGSDIETAKARCEQVDVNKMLHAELSRLKAVPNQYRAIHNATYRGQFNGREAKDLRGQLGTRKTPLHKMSRATLSINTHAKILSFEHIQKNTIPLADQPLVFESIAQKVTADSLKIIGDQHVLGISDHPQRGLILDVVRQLPAASSATA